MEELRSLLYQLAQEFSAKGSDFIKMIQSSFTHRPSFLLKKGFYPDRGTKRGQNGYNGSEGSIIDTYAFQSAIARFIADFPITKQVYEYISGNNLWPSVFESYEKSLRAFPSINSAVSGGFICRLFDLNNKLSSFSPESMETAFRELQESLTKDHVHYELYIHLNGVSGEIPVIEINEEVSIVQAGFDLARIFSIQYYRDLFNNTDVFENDYLLKTKISVSKLCFDFKHRDKEHNKQVIENALKDKWLNLPTLAISGIVAPGKQIRISSDWAFINDRAVDYYGQELDLRKQTITHSITEHSLDLIHQTARIIELTEFDKLDKKIRYSMERLKKSKAALNIDDRVVELAIAFEFLINTTNNDVTLQLCLKAIKLAEEGNIDEEVYGKLKKFYNLRSKIIHGNDKVENTQINADIIDYAELIVRKATLRLIELNKDFSYDQIEKALTKSLYISKSIPDLLNDQL